MSIKNHISENGTISKSLNKELANELFSNLTESDRIENKQIATNPIQISPKLIQDYIRINYKNIIKQKYTIEIKNEWGKTLKTIESNTPSPVSVIINLENLSKGTYTISLSHLNKAYTKKFIKF